MTSIIESRKPEIRRIVCETLEIDPEQLTETSSFRDDHDADSLRAIEIVAALEEELGIKIDQSELVRMVDLAGVYAVVSEALDGQ
ncbi:acyl carrier protein [Actinophytocola sp.]|uniref:acyl carrier protein n=1 Tax=Actinophytocola sp. TaxID=1872138 RepID=UPI003D6A752A